MSKKDEKVIEVSSNSKEYFDLAKSYYEQENYDEAIYNYQEAIKIDSKYAVTYYNLGLIYYEQKKYEKSIYEFDKAIKLAPSDKAYYRAKENSLSKLKKYNSIHKVNIQNIK